MNEEPPGAIGDEADPSMPPWDQPAVPASDNPAPEPEDDVMVDAVVILDVEVYLLDQRPKMLQFAEEVLGPGENATRVIHEVTLYISALWPQILRSPSAEATMWEVLSAAVLEEAHRADREVALAEDLGEARRLIDELIVELHTTGSEIGLYDALRSLSRGEFAAVMIKKVMGFSSCFAAWILNVHPSTVDRNYRRAMQALTDDLTPRRLLNDHIATQARGGRR